MVMVMVKWRLKLWSWLDTCSEDGLGSEVEGREEFRHSRALVVLFPVYLALRSCSFRAIPGTGMWFLLVGLLCVGVVVDHFIEKEFLFSAFDNSFLQ